MPSFATIASRLGDLASGFVVGQKQREQEINQQNIQSLQLGVQLGQSGLDPSLAQGIVNYDGNTQATKFFDTGAAAGQASFKRAQEIQKLNMAFKQAEFDLAVRKTLIDERGVNNNYQLGLARLDNDREIAGFNATNALRLARMREEGDNARTEATLGAAQIRTETEAANRLQISRATSAAALRVRPDDLDKLEGVINSRLTTLTGADGKPLFGADAWEKNPRGGYQLTKEANARRLNLIGNFYDLAASRGASSIDDYQNVFNQLSQPGALKLNSQTGQFSLDPFVRMPERVDATAGREQVVSIARGMDKAQRAQFVERIRSATSIDATTKSQIISTIEALP